MLKSLKIAFLLIVCSWSGGVGFAQQWDGSGAEVFVLDENDDTSDKIILQFGTALGKYLEWDTVNARFNLNDTLRVTGNLEQDGTVLTFDADNAGAGTDIDIVANQGTDNPGTIRYNATSNQWEFSNDGGSFDALGGGGGNMLIFDETLADDGSVTLTHAEDANNQRIVQIKQQNTNTTQTDSSLDFETADEADFIQENAANTSFAGGLAQLEANYTGAVGATNLAQGQPATASTSSQPATNAVDGNNGSFWYTTAGGSNGGWVQVDLGSGAPAVRRATVRWYNATGTYNCTNFEIQGTNTDGTGYATVYTGNTVADPQESTYNFTPSTYRYWRFLCTTANNANYYVVNEARLFEALATYPVVPHYITTGTNAVSTTGWTTLTNFNLTQNVPTGTSIRYLVSFDGRTTWKYWNGSAWTASSLANLQTQGMTEATIEGLSSAQWFAAGGVNSDAAQTLDLAFDLGTANNTVTPSVDQLDITYSTPVYWEVNTESYDIQEFSTTETKVTNKTGSTKDVKITIMVP